MFLSLKWKAVTFLSLVLIALLSAWLAQHSYTTFSNYDVRIKDIRAQQQVTLKLLFDDNFLRLSQVSQLIAEMPAIKSPGNSKRSLLPEQYLQSEWINININTGVDYVGLYSIDGENLTSALNQNLFQDRERLQRAINRAIQGSSTRTPGSFIYCGYGCAQFVIEPFVRDDGSEALIVAGQNIADIIQHYQQVSNNDLAVLLPTSVDSALSLDSSRNLINWNMRLWAASRFQKTFAQLRKIQRSVPLNSAKQHDPQDIESKKLVLNELELVEYEAFGLSPMFLAIRDETKQYNKLVDSLKVSVLIGLFVFVISESILVCMMMSPLRRLGSLVDALKLLPKHEYQEARRKIQSRGAYFQDELTLLEKSTQFVTSQLESLHVEVEKKNASLQNQIAVISRSRAFLERLIDSSQLFILTHDMDGKLLTKNAHFEKTFRRPISNFAELFMLQESRDAYLQKIKGLNKNEYELFKFDAEFSSDEGATIHFEWGCSVVEDEQGQNIVLAVGIDQTQRKRDESALQWLASNDPLTGIGNRRAFQYDLEKMLETQNSGAIIFIDVNRFKQINDLYGHTVGDLVLIQIASSLRDAVRQSDSISRLAGDEFTVILPNIKSQQLEHFLQKLSEKLNGHVELEEQLRTIEYSVSIGAALSPDHGTTEQDLIAHADMAMYQAKKSGGNQWQIFDPANNDLADMRRDHELIALLKQALKKDNLFELYYQPIYSIEHKTVSHYEVLLRLRNASGEMIFPNDFIPTAERMGLISLVDEWVLDHAVHRLAVGSEAGHRFSLSINISAPTLQSDQFPGVLRRLLRKYPVDPCQIIVELTETAYIENFQMVLKNLQRISEAGILVALDDFGVGFSSFNYLKMLPLSYVKLDGSYILDLENNPDNQVFVESLNKMVNAFGMKTIAEFVEDETTLKKLGELGITYAQGYYIGKPSPDLDAMVMQTATSSWPASNPQLEPE